jgi:hypothetical protein
MLEGSTLKGNPATLNLQTFNRIRVVPRRPSFVPDVDEGFFVFIGRWTVDGRPLVIKHCPWSMVHRPYSKGGTNEKENKNQLYLLETRPSSSGLPSCPYLLKQMTKPLKWISMEKE